MFKKIVWLWFKTRWKNSTQDIAAYVKNVVDSWATEFFTGYNPPYWYEKFWFEVSPNGRFAEHEQIIEFETLKTIVEEVHKHKNIDWNTLEIFLNFNAWYYTSQTMPMIEKMYDEICEIWVDWLIVWNISMLEFLKRKWWRWKINISTIMALYNKEAIRFFLDRYKVNRIIFGREVTLAEIEDIVTTFPETQFEVWWEGDFCRYNNWICFAEHKYWARDICTVVVNDLIIKKSYNPEFKKIALDENMNLEEKLKLLDDTYIDPFSRIDQIFEELELEIGDKSELQKELIQIISQNKNRADLFFDSLKSSNDKRNKNIISFYKAIKFANSNLDLGENELEIELKKSIDSGMKFFSNKLKELSGKTNIKAEELNLFYNRSDALNLFNVAYFSQFPNVVTMKFPTRWRNHGEKLKMIEDVFDNWAESVYKYLDRWISLERTYYDQSHIFSWDKLWFRKMLNEKF